MSNAHRELRAQFPALDGGLCFLDWGATGLPPRTAVEAVGEFMEHAAACPGAVSTWMHAAHGGGTRSRVRALVARMLGGGASPGDVAIVESTTAGINGAASSIRLREGDNVVLSAIDYLAVATPWKHRAQRDGIELRYAPSARGELEIDAILSCIDERTRVVCVSTLAWTTGALLDGEALSRETRLRGILLILDAIQTFGVAPLDLGRVHASFVAAGGHKWLCSPLGAGFLYVHPLVAARHQPPYVGFLSGRPAALDWPAWFESPDSGPDDPVVFPAAGRTFETGGTANLPGAIGLWKSLELLAGAGVESIREHVLALGDQLIEGLDRLGLVLATPRPRERRAGIVTFQTGEGQASEKALANRLADRGIVVSVRYCGGFGGVRVSLHGMNNRADVERLLDALADG